MLSLALPEVLDADGASMDYGDLTLTPGGNLSLVDGLAGLQQRVTQSLRFWLHESFLDYQNGVPYVSGIFQRAIPVGLASTIIIEHVVRIAEVERVTDVVANVDPATRRLSWSATVHAMSGGSVAVSVEV